MANKCPKCGSSERVKSGFAHGLQRYFCKNCECSYTKENGRGYSKELKEKAKQLYLEGVGFRGIGRILGVSNVAVLKWIKAFGKKAVIKQNRDVAKVDIMEIDEMHSYVQKKTLQFGCGWLLIELPKTSSASGLVLVAKERSKK